MKKAGTEVRRDCTGDFMREKGFSHRQQRFIRSSYFPPSIVFKKSFEKAQKQSRDFKSEDVEELAKQTLLSTEDVEILGNTS